MKKLLILGGTAFVGRVVVEDLLEKSYDITLFNRGKRNSDLFPDVKKLFGDRETDEIGQIFKKDWDCIIDLSGYYPLTLDKLADNLKGKVGRYIFISTISVYDLDKYLNEDVSEKFETLPCTEEQKEPKDLMLTYGNKKAECERVLLSKDWLDTIIFRPSLIYGKYDYTDRFYYWLYKIMNQENVLVPQSKSLSNYTFVDDFAKLIVESIEMKEYSNIYNATTHEPISFKDLIKTIVKLSNKNPNLVKASQKFLETNKISQWSDLPVWITSNMMIDNTLLKQDFKTKLTPFDTSIKNVIDFYNSEGWHKTKAGISEEKEKELIEKISSLKKTKKIKE